MVIVVWFVFKDLIYMLYTEGRNKYLVIFIGIFIDEELGDRVIFI